MSDAKKAAAPAPAPEGGGHGGKKNSKLLIMIVVGVLVLALIGGGVYFKMKKSADEEDGEEDAHPTKTEKPKEPPKAPKKEKKPAVTHIGPPVFYKFDKPFTIRLQSENSQESYMQVEMQLKLLEPTVQEQIKQFEPEIKYKVTLLMLSKKPSEVASATGVQRLANEVRDAINNVLDMVPPRLQNSAPPEPADMAGPNEGVQAVLFTTFVVQ